MAQKKLHIAGNHEYKETESIISVQSLNSHLLWVTLFAVNNCDLLGLLTNVFEDDISWFCCKQGFSYWFI